MKKLAFISDLIFTFCVSFLFTLCFFRFLRVGLFLSLALSALCGALTACAVAAVLNARRKKFFLKKSDAETQEKLLVHLALLSDEELTDYFFRYFQTEEGNEPPTRRENLQLSVGENFFYLHFRFAPVAADDVADLFRIQTPQTKILLCAAIEPQAKALCEKLKIGVRTGEEVYAALKKADVLPQTYLGSDEKRRRKFKLKLWFAKTNARRFLTSAALILFLSFLTPFFYYYLIFGTVLLLAAVFVRIFGYDAPTQ
ncbi:MAG: hypothetical protein IJ308_01145 [Clostridia bacterium]|nr:hypothetical protein [Clostridia bacterium]